MLLGSMGALASSTRTSTPSPTPTPAKPPTSAPTTTPKPNLFPTQPSAAAASADDTKCEKCHTTSGFKQAAFDHDKTGFPLKGAHAGASCKECHAAGFDQPISKTCAGCHEDPHKGEFGAQCQGCHTEQTWQPLFNVDAHRFTNFPLVGRHAFIPCTECHTSVTDRNFAHDTVDCVRCHQADYNGTVTSQVNHVALGFGTQCATCHSGATWHAAKFTAHDRCFQITGGPHSGISCKTCHSEGIVTTASGSCTGQSFACAACHAHACSKMDSLHAKASFHGATGVPGYDCSDQKCYACHAITSSP